MSKISQYLNEHLLGEVTSSEAIRDAFSRDASILSVRPEIVVYPKVTNDIRKAARFAWQLAEKGHVLPLTTRGGGTDLTGAAVGKGVIINTTAHLNDVIYVGLKDKDRFIHVQPGITFKSLNDILKSHGSFVPSYPESEAYSTIGGAVANNASGILSGKYGATGEWVNRLEIVLANGDLIETGRISKKELNKKKGLQTFEGELYRKIDGIIEDNQDVIAKIADEIRDNSGYHGITKVKEKDGSFDLTPLFIGSQGTLGIISEVVLRTEFFSADESVIVATLAGHDMARDAADSLKSLQPSILETFDGDLFNEVQENGKNYAFTDSTEEVATVGSVLFVSFNDFADHQRSKKLKKAAKILSKLDATILSSEEHDLEDLYAIRNVSSSLFIIDKRDEAYVPMLEGASIPAERLEDFSQSVGELAVKYHVSLPLHIRSLDGVVTTRPKLDLQKVGDKQKVFKLITEYTDLVFKANGSILSVGGEGRLRSNAIYAALDNELLRVFTEIRETFDPYGTLNPGVKQTNEIHALVQSLRSSYDLSNFAGYVSSN